MKKYLLTAFLGLFGFIGTFTSALDISFDDENQYTPDGITLNSDIHIGPSSITNFNCNEDTWCVFSIFNSSLSEVCEIGYYSEGDFEFIDCDLVAGDYTFGYSEGYPFNSISINFGDNSAGGNGNEGGTIIQGGINTFTPVISRMLEIAGEFIPYIVYIFIGYLGVVLLWNAVKYILGYLKGKSEGSFENREKHYVKRDGGTREETEEERQTRLEDEKFLRERKQQYGY